MAIKGFFGENRFLSNFWFSKVWYDGIEYPSVEHAYQAAKTFNPKARLDIAKLNKPGDAKRAGNDVMLRPDWEEVKVGIMTYLVREKFKNNSSLRRQLLATGDQYLEETNTWRDTFWGVCNGVGQNWLGKILMLVRTELKEKG